MHDFDSLKTIPIKTIIEKETGFRFSKNGHSHILEKCPFCNSGTGKNKTSAFSVDSNKNIFKCFSCDKKGNTIEFIKYLKNIDNKSAIKYLIDNYSDLPKFEPTQEIKEQTDILKIIYAILKNDINRAGAYLKTRGLNISIIKGFYNYDSLKNAVCFIDTEKQLVNYRNIEDNQKGFVKGSKIENAIFDKTFISEKEKVFITEGVINSLSLFVCGFSSVSLFTSQNKFTDKNKFDKYFNNRNIVLAFDNDQAGEQCTDYYKKFIINNYPVKSLSILVLPKDQDLNDLLKNKVLENYISENNHYQIIKHDYYKEIIPDSEDPGKDYKEKGFYIEKSQYFKKRSIGKGQTIPERLSNFIMQILFHFKDGTPDSKRLVKIQRNDSEINLIELRTSELLSLEKFNSIIGSKLNKGCNFIGQHREHKNIITYLYDDEKTAIPLFTLGYNPESDLFAFSNLVINKNNSIIKPDELGILYDHDSVFYLPTSSKAAILNKTELSSFDFFYKEGNLNFENWAKLIYYSYGLKGLIGVCYLINALFRDFIFNEIGFFPFLYLYGEAGTGKTSFISFILSVFNNSQGDKGHSLNNSNIKGLARSLSQYKNYIVYFKEYSQTVDSEILELLKTGYDGSGYTRANKTNDNSINSVNVESAIVLDGNSLPTYEAAIFDRIILLEFNTSIFTKESEQAYSTLKNEMKIGFGQIVKEIIKHRSEFIEKFVTTYNAIIKSIKYEGAIYSGINLSELRDRTIKHVAFIIAPLQIMQDILKFPVNDIEIIKEIIQYSIEKETTLNKLKPISVFWSALSSEGLKKGSQIISGKHYAFDTSYLYIKFDEMYIYYSNYCKSNNIKISDKHELRKLLTSSNYKPFVKGNRKDSPNVVSHIHHEIGSCLRFSFHKIEDQKYIGDIEINLP